MRSTEFISELDYRKSIHSKLSKAGYKKIGEGTFSVAYVKDAGTVFKLIVPDYDEDPTDAERVFFDFYNYCQAHKNNPYLLKFLTINGKSYEKFTIEGKEFYQIVMEKLSNITPGSVLDTVGIAMVTSAERKESFEEYIARLEKDKEEYSKLNPIWKTRYNNYIKESYNLKGFFDTLVDVIAVGKQKGYENDLYTHENANIMRRGNIPVIMDPWV